MPLSPADILQITNLITTQLAASRIKISELPAAGAITRNAVFPIVDNGSTQKLLLSTLLAQGFTVVPTGQDLRDMDTDELEDESLFYIEGVTTPGDLGAGFWIYDADSVETDNIGTVISPNSAVGRFLRQYQGPISVGWFDAKKNDVGAAATNVTAFQEAMDYVEGIGGGQLYVPDGTFTLNNSIVLGAGINFFGSGRVSTVLSFTHTGDGLQQNSPVNSTTSIRSEVTDIQFTCTNALNAGGAFTDTSGTYLILRRCLFQRFKYGVIFDQTEVSSIVDCEFLQKVSEHHGLWLVNGDDRTTGADTLYTNRITVERCQFNADFQNCIQVIDDGGTVHSYINNNFNGGLTAIRAAGVYSLTIIGGNQSEVHADSDIELTNTKFSGDPIGPCQGIKIEGNWLISLAPQNIKLIDGVNGSIQQNFFGQATTAAITFIDPSTNPTVGLTIGSNSKFNDNLTQTPTPFFSYFSRNFRNNCITQVAMTAVEDAQASGAQTFEPLSMEFISVGTRLLAKNQNGSDAEDVIVTAVTSTTATATFATAKTADWMIIGCTPFQEEQGTFTPVLSGSSTPGTQTYTTQRGTWSRRGDWVEVQINLVVTVISGAVGAWIITGLPFVSQSSVGELGAAALAGWGGVTLGAGYTAIGGLVTPGSTQVALVKSGTAVAYTPLAVADGAATMTINLNISYNTSSIV